MKSDLIYGVHSVTALLNCDPDSVRELWLQIGRRGTVFTEALGLAQKNKLPLHTLSRTDLQRLCEGGSHQGIAVRYVGGKRLALTLHQLLICLREPPLLLMLDAVDDPRNLGACMRSAEATGAHAVVIPRSRGTSLTPVVHKVASGATQTLPLLRVANLAREMKHIAGEGIRIIGTAPDARRTIAECDLRQPTALVLGSESRGIRRLTREHCNEIVRIPIVGTVSSFNVSVAAGICLYEAMRQRSFGLPPDKAIHG